MSAMLLAAPARGAVDVGTAQKLAQVAVPFVANDGQWDSRAAYAAQTFAGTLYVTQEGRLVYSLPGRRIAGPRADGAGAAQSDSNATRPDARTSGWAITETFVGPDQQPITATPAGAREATARVSYFNDHDTARHRRDLQTFERIALGDVFPGVNVQLRATGANVEKIFTVAPGQDPRRIRLRIDGAMHLALGAAGELIVDTGNGPIAFTAPVAFQEDSLGRREGVDVRYALDAATRQYGFVVAAYDAARPLVIDPLLQSTYLGGAGNEDVKAIAIHPASHEVYVAGFTDSNPFPQMTGGAIPASAGLVSFVSRFSADLKTLHQSSYAQGSPSTSSVYDAAFSYAAGLAIHPTGGDVYVAIGDTVSRFNAALTTISATAVIGGAASTAVAIHPVSGEIYVAGTTTSATLAGADAGAAQPTYAGGDDAFVSRLSADLGTLFRSTYVGGAGQERGSALAIHPSSGIVYVGGLTNSDPFPGTAGGAQPTFAGGTDGFVTALLPDLSPIVRSTYLGSSATQDFVTALAVHPINNDVYVAGFGGTSSNIPFPGLAGGAQPVAIAIDMFVSRLSPDLATVRVSTFIGGTGSSDRAYALAIHPSTGEIYVAGISGALNFPGLVGGVQEVQAGLLDVALSRLNAGLTSILQSTLLGAVGYNLGFALTLDPVNGNLYVAGRTQSPTNTFPGVSGGAQGTFGGGPAVPGVYGGDGFISLLTTDLTAGDTTPDPFAFSAQNNVPVSSVRTAGPVQITGLIGQTGGVYVDGQPGSTYCASTAANCSDCDISLGYIVSGGITNGKYVCVRHTASSLPSEITSSTLHIGAVSAKFWVSTGNIFQGGCTLDVDGNSAVDALTDGLILLRAMFGLTGTAVTNGAVGGGATRTTWALLQPYLNANCGTSFSP